MTDFGTFTHRGRLYDLGLLFASVANRSQSSTKIERLKAVDGNVVPIGTACASCKYGPANWHERRVNEADLSFPILVHPDGTVLDGLHRLEKGIRRELSQLPSIEVSDADLLKCLISGLSKDKP